MGDRLAIVGGQLVGRDHFPFPIPEPDFLSDGVGDGRQFPFELSLDDYAKWFYLVRKWRFEFSLSFQEKIPDGMGGGTIQSGDANFSFDMEWANYNSVLDHIINAREAELVLDQQSVFGTCILMSDGTVSFDEFPTGTVSNSSASCSLDDGAGSDLITVRPVFGRPQTGGVDVGFIDPSFYPKVYLHCDDSSGIRHYISDYLTTPLVTLDRDLGTITFDGDFATGGKTDAPATLTGVEDDYAKAWVDLSFTATPIKFWPYATTSGDPVYDEDDGSIINDPFS